MSEIVVRAGERRRIIRRFSSSLSQSFPVHAEPLTAGDRISGTVEVCGSRWLFARDPLVLDLEPDMTVEKGFWDTRYSVFVTPDVDLRVTVGRPRLR